MNCNEKEDCVNMKNFESFLNETAYPVLGYS